ncbi:MAG: hypothetical protein BWZ00_01446 [Bacteroidetes bacterium ADurb.BinA174]|jgi:hypothetical protein|nr:MAG: hypothetical protein BWZ00_01446 [Bacteroidetes bacterium ADurb.BinA174]
MKIEKAEDVGVFCFFYFSSIELSDMSILNFKKN